MRLPEHPAPQAIRRLGPSGFFPQADAHGSAMAEDVAALVKQLQSAGISPVEIRAQLDAAMGDPQALLPVARLRERVEKIIAGKWRSIPLPWRLLETLAQPNLPGNLVVFAGGVGSCKSFSML